MTAAGAGWYDDPHSPGIVRYWDGAAWTDRRAPKPVPGQGGDRTTDMAGVLLLAVLFVLVIAAIWGMSVYWT